MIIKELNNFCKNLEQEINTRDADVYFYDDDEDVYKKITSVDFYSNKIVIHLERDYLEEEK